MTPSFLSRLWRRSPAVGVAALSSDEAWLAWLLPRTTPACPLPDETVRAILLALRKMAMGEFKVDIKPLGRRMALAVHPWCSGSGPGLLVLDADDRVYAGGHVILRLDTGGALYRFVGDKMERRAAQAEAAAALAAAEHVARMMDHVPEQP